ncbi:G patch domain and ankyrin repeat-containing protein 1 [Dissophora globulifera]|nr:G patch domain and ankyrin repeat-containing protein 1 [Dissophora globulifera]
MDNKRASRGGSKKVLRQDESGTYYRDIAFVPSGTLAMKEATGISVQTNKQEDAINVREFYQTVLAMPRTVAARRRRKAGMTSTVQQTVASTTNTTTTTMADGSAPEESSLSSTVLPAQSIPVLDASNAAEEAEVIRRNWQGDQGPTRVVADGYILCESCQIEVREDDMDRHCRGTAHLISQESHIKPLDTLALGHGNKGFRMLVNSGWDYEKGLGIEGQGKRHPVATRLKQDRLALGAAGSSKKVVTHTFEEIEKSRAKPAAKSERRVPLSLEDYQRQAEKERRDRVNLMTYMKK